MPHFIGHGSHHMNNNKHRFIVLPRFGDDIWNKFLTNGEKFPLHTVYRLAIQMVCVINKLLLFMQNLTHLNFVARCL